MIYLSASSGGAFPIEICPVCFALIFANRKESHNHPNFEWSNPSRMEQQAQAQREKDFADKPIDEQLDSVQIELRGLGFSKYSDAVAKARELIRQDVGSSSSSIYKEYEQILSLKKELSDRQRELSDAQRKLRVIQEILNQSWQRNQTTLGDGLDAVRG